MRYSEVLLLRTNMDGSLKRQMNAKKSQFLIRG